MKKILFVLFYCNLHLSLNAKDDFDALWKKFDSIQKVSDTIFKPKVLNDYKSIPANSARKEMPKTDSAIKIIKNIPIEGKEGVSEKTKTNIVDYKKNPTTELQTKKDILNNKLEDKSEMIEKSKQIIPNSIVENPIKKTDISKSTKSKFDTSKNFKDFSFETTPIVNGNATYNKPNPTKAVKANEIDEKIPVNKTLTLKTTSTEGVLAKSNYSEFSKDAEIVRKNNDKKLDSVLKTMQLNIPVQFNPNDYIDIYINGGCVLIDNDSKAGDQRVEKNISREQLVKLAQYIIDLGFFDFKESYDCFENDAACNERLTTNPVALPLQITITIGERKSKVYVAIYSPKSEKIWVNYPSNLDKIMAAIYSVVEK
jgi:hypothetical protein